MNFVRGCNKNGSGMNWRNDGTRHRVKLRLWQSLSLLAGKKIVVVERNRPAHITASDRSRILRGLPCGKALRRRPLGFDPEHRHPVCEVSAVEIRGPKGHQGRDILQLPRLRQLGGSELRLTRRGSSVIVELPGQLDFEVGSARLSSGALAALSGVARILADYRLTIISVEGHTDDSGNAASNRTLSEQRASAVARQLISQGVEAERMVVVGHGSDQPVADNSTELGREANRRVVIRVDALQR